MSEQKTKLSVTMEPGLSSILSDEDMEALRAAGLKYLALPAAFYDLGEEKVRARWEILARMGFVADTCHPPFGGGNQKNSLCAEDEAVRAQTIETYRHYIRAFKWTGMRAIPVHTGGAMHPAGGKKALARLTDTLRQILPDAKDSHVILALENTFYMNPCPFSDAKNPSGIDQKYINDDCAMLRDYVRAFGDENVRICHDAGHSILFGNDLTHDLSCLWADTVLYHLHYNDGVDDLHFNVGAGAFPWDTLRAFFREHPPVCPVYDEVLNDPDKAMVAVLKRPDRVIHYYRQACETLNG